MFIEDINGVADTAERFENKRPILSISILDIQITDCSDNEV